MRLRKMSAVTVILGPPLPRRDRSEEEKALWYRVMLILFKPWRTRSELREGFPTWEAAWNSHIFTPDQRSFMRNTDVLHQCKDARDNHARERRKSRIVPSEDADHAPTLDGLEDSVLLDESL
ncbi:hypothetical protein CALCODRAFT_439624, partial [Calocera cornea HHB12733]